MSKQEIDFGYKYDNNFVGRPPHMSSEDWPIWYRYLSGHAHLYDHYFFDVCLPSSCECPASSPPNMKKMWNRVTGKRIDALCRSERGWTIVECRIHASCGALGAILIYSELWKEYSPAHIPCNLIIVTDTLDPDLVKIAPIFGVQLIKV